MSDIKFNWKNLSLVEKKVIDEIAKQNVVLQGILEERETIPPDEADVRSLKKYFKKPKMKDDSGNSHDGWDKILKVLKDKDGKPDIKKIEVDIEFNLKDPSAEEDTDLTMEIKTTFAIESKAGAMDPIIEGSLFHRRICTFEP